MKEYPVPDELVGLDIEYGAYCTLRDRYVKIPWGFKKAKKCAIEANRIRVRFWSEIRKLYPEIKRADLRYDAIIQCVTVVDDS